MGEVRGLLTVLQEDGSLPEGSREALPRPSPSAAPVLHPCPQRASFLLTWGPETSFHRPLCFSE